MLITFFFKKKPNFSHFTFTVLTMCFLSFEIGLFAAPSSYLNIDYCWDLTKVKKDESPNNALTATPPNLIISSISATEDCYQTGTANVNVSGGILPYSYNWSNGGQSNKITDLAAGTYAVTVSDANGQTSIDSTVVASSQSCSSVPCGNSYTKLNSYTVANAVSGALQYRFTFTPINSNNPVVVHQQSGNYIYFSAVSDLYYNTSYDWTVEVEYSPGVWGGLSASNCTISFEEPESSPPCGNSYSKLNSYTTTPSIHNATNYRFTFIDTTGNLPPVVKVQPGNYIYFNTVPGLYYNTTYNWTVEVEYEIYNGSLPTLKAWGPPSDSTCTITFEEPKSSPPCGNSYSKLNSYTTTPLIHNASRYRFTFIDTSGNLPSVVKEQPGNYIYFNNVPGLYYNTTYNWTVEVEYEIYNGALPPLKAWGPPSDSTCTITFKEPKSSPPCGNSYTKLNSYTTTPLIHNASKYRFTFIDTSGNLPSVVKEQPSNYIYFNNVTGLYYNTTYYWTVEVEYDVYNDSLPPLKAWGSPSDSTCTITFEEPKSSPPCGNSYSKLNSYTTTPIVHNASRYRFTFIDANGNVPNVVKEQTGNYIYFNNVPGLYYNTTYNWTVEVEYEIYNGALPPLKTWGPSSDSTCPITFEEPKSSPPCGQFFSSLSTYTTTPIVHNAINYRFTFSESPNFTNPIIKEQPSNYVYFSTIPGLNNNTSYYWTVEVEYEVYGSPSNSFDWGPPSDSPCIVSFGGGSFQKKKQVTDLRKSKEEIKLEVFPNPATNSTISISALCNPQSTINVFDTNGRLIYEQSNIDEESTLRLENLNSGTYFVRLQNENQSIIKKIVVL